MVRCICIDDELYALEALSEYINLYPGLELITTYCDPVLALKEISTSSDIDIIFMDIDMPTMSGLELSEALRSKTNKLIFTTSHSKYAFDAFEVNANAFLLKPYNFAKFATIISRMNLGENKDMFATDRDDFFFAKNSNDNLKLVKIRYQDIIAIESLKNYIAIYTIDAKIITYLGLQEMKKQLAGRSEFVQVQRSYMISKNFLLKVDGNTIEMQSGLKIQIGNYYKSNFFDFIKNKLIYPNRIQIDPYQI